MSNVDCARWPLKPPEARLLAADIICALDLFSWHLKSARLYRPDGLYLQLWEHTSSTASPIVCALTLPHGLCTFLPRAMAGAKGRALVAVGARGMGRIMDTHGQGQSTTRGLLDPYTACDGVDGGTKPDAAWGLQLGLHEHWQLGWMRAEQVSFLRTVPSREKRGCLEALGESCWSEVPDVLIPGANAASSCRGSPALL